MKLKIYDYEKYITKFLIEIRIILIDVFIKKRKSNIKKLKPITRNFLSKNEQKEFFKKINSIIKLLKLDYDAYIFNDPSIKNSIDIILYNNGFQSIICYRFGNSLPNSNFSKILHAYACSKYSIDIHPKAIIGTSFFIDHGLGIVIGESSVIGHHVRLFHGVTLGAIKIQKNQKRHPTIGDYVTIYCYATILNGTTLIGNHTTIGAHCFITKSIPPYKTVYVQANQHLIKDAK